MALLGECGDGSRRWYVNGKRHRVDGPAVEYANGRKEWWADDKLHRVDGPAIDDANGDRGRCVLGVRQK